MGFLAGCPICHDRRVQWHSLRHVVTVPLFFFGVSSSNALCLAGQSAVRAEAAARRRSHIILSAVL